MNKLLLNNKPKDSTNEEFNLTLNQVFERLDRIRDLLSTKADR